MSLLQIEKSRPREAEIVPESSAGIHIWLYLVFRAGPVLIGRCLSFWLFNVLSVALVTQLDGGGRIQTSPLVLEPRPKPGSSIHLGPSPPRNSTPQGRVNVYQSAVQAVKHSVNAKMDSSGTEVREAWRREAGL